MQIEHAIIGTGPSAVAAAAALIDVGLKPTFVDAGSLENGKVLLARTLEKKQSRENRPHQSGGSGQKAWFGSYETYRQKFNSRMHFEEALNVRPSNAIGGFSRIWGATFEFWPQDSRWPTEAQPQDVDFAKITGLLPHTRVNFDQEVEIASGLTAASSSNRIFSRLISKTKQTNFALSPATLAVETSGPNGCIHCLNCLEGCPQDSIWFSGTQIQTWLNKNNANLVEGLFVEKIVTLKDYSEIICIDKNNDTTTLTAKKIYLAAGAVGTANIILNSTNLNEIVIKDTSTIFTAGLSLKKQPQEERGHTLSQFWLNWNANEKFGAQVYAPNISNASRLINRFEILRRFERELAPLIRRLHPIIVYLDESKSPTIVMRKAPEGNKVFEGSNSEYRKFRKTSITRLRQTLQSAGLFIPPIGTDYSPAGTGYHFGASLPMGRLSDNLGRIEGWKNVHIVDSSVLPYLNVGSITPTVMANAHRIARQSLDSRE